MINLLAFPTRLEVLALELPRGITPTVAGLTVGAVVGVVGFVVVLLLVGRGDRRARRMPMAADRVVFIPPYGTLPRATPLPPQAFATPPRAFHQPVPAPMHARLPFVPSTELSARVFAKMGYDVDEGRDAPGVDPFVELEMTELDEDELAPEHTSIMIDARAPAVTVAPIVMVSRSSAPPPPPAAPPAPSSGSVRAADKSAPHPLGIIKSSSPAMRPAPLPREMTPPRAVLPPRDAMAMRAAPIADLAFDDSPTEIGETYFDEPPQPRRRTDPPKIRAVAPAAPRFPEATPPLPRVTPPPTRAAQVPRP